jgi:hypothetical protein
MVAKFVPMTPPFYYTCKIDSLNTKLLQQFLGMFKIMNIMPMVFI